MAALSYNERSWAIDVVVAIGELCSTRNWIMQRAGGEHSLNMGGKCLFPDILLFQDRNQVSVLNGWELKLPDTPVNDIELINNAEAKANRLGTTSFVIWNADIACLYVRKSNEFALHWQSEKVGYKSRNEVTSSDVRWRSVLLQILEQINLLYVAGSLDTRQPASVIGEDLYVSLLDAVVGPATDSLKSICRRDARLKSEIEIWWQMNEAEFRGKQSASVDVMYRGYSTLIVIGWINRFIFSHALIQYRNEARVVLGIDVSCDIQNVAKTFNELVSSTDFYNILSVNRASECVGSIAFSHILSLNSLLCELRFNELSQEILHKVIDSTLEISRKKSAGLYSTPRNLARLLSRLAIMNYEHEVWDPCGGTGTIARTVYDLKKIELESKVNALKSTWVSDKFTFPLQLATIAIADPENMGGILKIFRRDVFEMQPNMSIDFIDPSNGAITTEKMPSFGTIVSNLPFVRFESFERMNNALATDISTIMSRETQELVESLNKRADLYAHIMLRLYNYMADDGSLGVIVSNSWLGTEWGSSFKDSLDKLFNVEFVITSGMGRWFNNADVVATILILRKKTDSNEINENYVVIESDIHEMSNSQIDSVARSLLAGKKSDLFSIVSYTKNQKLDRQSLGFEGYSYFASLDWIEYVKPYMVRASVYLDFCRGERRGWDAMFYPDDPQMVDSVHLRKVLKSIRQSPGYTAVPSGSAFCCSMSVDEMKSRGYLKSLSWISKFENAVNEVGSPLKDVLSRSNSYWYEMKTDSLADFAMSINPDRVLKVVRLTTRGFVNQRLVSMRFQPDELVDVDFMHCLLNSTISLLSIESIGFGRGLGVLDLNSTKLERSLNILNPSLFPSEAKTQAIDIFSRIVERGPLSVPEELDAHDRHDLDCALFSALGVDVCLVDKLHDDLRRLYRIRRAARP